jgi:hypothetical protein
MASFSLTTGDDTVVAPASGATVYATAATLNAGDSLTGGAGTDVLELVGSGTFNLAQLASFTGFESVKLNNATNSVANLTLGSQPIEVDATGYLNIQVTSLSNWNGSDVINGDPSTSLPTTSLSFSNLGGYPASPVTYDLTGNTFSHVGGVSVGMGDNVTLLINSADTAGIQSFTASFGQNEQLVTAASTLDLSHTTVSGFRVASTNGVGPPSRSATSVRRFRSMAALGRTLFSRRVLPSPPINGPLSSRPVRSRPSPTRQELMQSPRPLQVRFP